MMMDELREKVLDAIHEEEVAHAARTNAAFGHDVAFVIERGPVPDDPFTAFHTIYREEDMRKTLARPLPDMLTLVQDDNRTVHHTARIRLELGV